MCFRKPPAFIIIMMLALFIGLPFSSCKNDLKDLPDTEEQQLSNNNRAKDVKFIFSRHGHTQATLESDTFINKDKAHPPYIDLKGHLKLTNYDTVLKVKSIVTAKFARYYPKTGNIIAEDSVVAKNSDGDRMETEQLIWNQKIQRFYTDDFVRIIKDGQLTYGDGFEANRDFSWFRIKHQRGTIPVDKSKLPE